MEAFSKVEDAVRNQVSESDTQQDWQSWKSSDQGRASQKRSNASHRPAFPKLSKHDVAKDAGEVQDELDEERQSGDRLAKDADESQQGYAASTNSNNKKRKLAHEEKSDPAAHSPSKRRNGKPVNQPNPFEQVQQALALHLAKTQQPHPSVSSSTLPRASTSSMDRWEQRIDPLTRKKYYIHLTTQERRDEIEQRQTDCEKKAWQKIKDPISGKVFWFCRQTGEKSFRKP